MLTKLLTGTTAGLLLLSAGLGLALDTEVRNHEAKKQQLLVAQASLAAYQVNVKELLVKQLAIDLKSKNIQSKFSATTRNLEALKNRESVILKRRGLIEIKINKAFNKQQKRLACITGELELC